MLSETSRAQALPRESLVTGGVALAVNREGLISRSRSRECFLFAGDRVLVCIK